MDRKSLIKLIETLVTYVNKDTGERESGIAEGFYDAAEHADDLAYNERLVRQVTQTVRALLDPYPPPFLGIVVRDGKAMHAMSNEPETVGAFLGELFVVDQDAGTRTPLALVASEPDQTG